MGVDATVRNTFANHSNYAPINTGAVERAPSQHNSPYAISTTDAAGHMRKLEELESEIIRLAILRYDGHMSEVARRLAIGRSTLYRKLKELGLETGEGESGEGTQHRAAS
jgi:DNA-binding NtrC family response regulator